MKSSGQGQMVVEVKLRQTASGTILVGRGKKKALGYGRRGVLGRQTGDAGGG
jgi:hypothetical protein